MKGLSLRRFWVVPACVFLTMLLLALLPAACSEDVVVVYQPPPPVAETPSPPPPSTPVPPTETPLPTDTPNAPWVVPLVEDYYFQPGNTDRRTPARLQAALILVFAQPIALEELAARLTLVPSIQGELSAVDPSTFAFTPQTPWQAGTRYQVRIARARGRNSFAFTTAPFVAVELPAAGPLGHDLDDSVRLTFGYPADPRIVESALRVEPEVAWSSRWQGLTLYIQPQDRWTMETTYRVGLAAEGMRAAGMPLEEDLSWSFTTRSAVLAYAPKESASPCSAVEVTFDRPADQVSVESALQITPAVTGTFEWRNNQVRFVPGDPWQVDTSYEVSLADTAAAADGTPLLRRPLRWRFTVHSSTGWLDFGYGPNLQVVDAAGPRLVQFYGHGALECGRFTVYQVSAEWLLANYSSSFKGEKSFSVKGLPPLRTWQQDLSPGELALPADIPPGLYVLSYGGTGEGLDSLLVVLTHYTLVLKEAAVGTGSSAEHQVVGYASAIASGRPRPGMAVRLYDRSGRLYGEGTTDGQGLFETTVSGDTDPLLALGEVEGEATLCGFGPEWNDLMDWWGWSPTPPTGRRFRAYVYTERPIYRPGQTVYVKAVVRADDDGVYSLPSAGTEVIVRLRDARDNVVGTRVLSTGEYGTVHTAFDLAEGGTLGTYHVEVVVGEEVTRQSLKVEEYRKPDYEVSVHVEEQRTLRGQPVTVTVEARYYFGRPVAGVPVSLQFYERESDYYGECGAEGCWHGVGRSQTCQTDDQGRCQRTLAVPRNEDWYWQNSRVRTYRVEATVEDGSGQSVSSYVPLQVHGVRKGASIFLEQYAYKPGEEIRLDLSVQDYQGKPVSQAQLDVGLYSWGGDRYDKLVVETQITTDKAGRAQATLQVDEQGWYRVGVKGYDQDEVWLWVHDPDRSDAWYYQGSDLTVTADKPSYTVGEVAQLLVRSPVTGTALLTLERGRVRRVRPVELTGSVTTIPVPIDPDFAPNIFATVQIYGPVERRTWSGRLTRPDAELLLDSTELVVPVPEQRLQVTITPERDTYAPREEAVIVLAVTDAVGRPVRAELSLAVVDEAIYGLSRDLSLDLLEAFYGRRQNLVRTYDSLRPMRYLPCECGGGGDGFDLGNPRRYFPDTAYWNPAIVTDEQGRAVVTLPLPDSLTRWRLVARAVTLDTQVGEGSTAITVTQALVVRPALPRFLVQGDTLTLTAAVHNYTGGDISAEVGVEVIGLRLAGAVVHTVGIAAGEVVEAEWAVEATTLGTVTITAYAAGPDFGDAVQHTIPVLPFAVPEVQSWSGEYIGERVEQVLLPSGFIPEATQVEVRLAPSVAPTLLDGLEYLIDYPFG